MQDPEYHQVLPMPLLGKKIFSVEASQLSQLLLTLSPTGLQEVRIEYVTSERVNFSSSLQALGTKMIL